MAISAEVGGSLTEIVTSVGKVTAGTPCATLQPVHTQTRDMPHCLLILGLIGVLHDEALPAPLPPPAEASLSPQHAANAPLGLEDEASPEDPDAHHLDAQELDRRVVEPGARLGAARRLPGYARALLRPPSRSV